MHRVRAKQPNGQFHHLGEVLDVPELSYRSPFLFAHGFDPLFPKGDEEVYDSDYERIPQQILSLIKLGEPRFVVYAWGQSLKPARRNPEDDGPSIVTTGPDRGLVRNYQITGEMATRTVMRVDFDLDPFTGRLDYRHPRLVVESFNVLPNE